MPRVEMLMMANHAEVVNGLLYVHGGGWSHHWRGASAPGQPPTASQLAIAATLLVEPNESAPSHPFTIRIRGASGEEVLRADGTFDVTTGSGPPEPRRLAFAANVAVVFPHDGAYTASAEAMGQPPVTVDFWVHDAAPGETPPQEPVPGTGGYI